MKVCKNENKHTVRAFTDILKPTGSNQCVVVNHLKAENLHTVPNSKHHTLKQISDGNHVFQAPVSTLRLQLRFNDG